MTASARGGSLQSRGHPTGRKKASISLPPELLHPGILRRPFPEWEGRRKGGRVCTWGAPTATCARFARTPPPPPPGEAAFLPSLPARLVSPAAPRGEGEEEEEAESSPSVPARSHSRARLPVQGQSLGLPAERPPPPPGGRSEAGSCSSSLAPAQLSHWAPAGLAPPPPPRPTPLPPAAGSPRLLSGRTTFAFVGKFCRSRPCLQGGKLKAGRWLRRRGGRPRQGKRLSPSRGTEAWLASPPPLPSWNGWRACGCGEEGAGCATRLGIGGRARGQRSRRAFVLSLSAPSTPRFAKEGRKPAHARGGSGQGGTFCGCPRLESTPGGGGDPRGWKARAASLETSCWWKESC